MYICCVGEYYVYQSTITVTTVPCNFDYPPVRGLIARPTVGSIQFVAGEKQESLANANVKRATAVHV